MKTCKDSGFKLQLVVCSAMSLPPDVITLSVGLKTSLEEVTTMVLEGLKENAPREFISVELASSPKLDDTRKDGREVLRLLKKDEVKATVIYLTQSQQEFDHKLNFSVTMAEKRVRSIEKEQFQDCMHLANITSSDCCTYLEEIGEYAFSNCRALGTCLCKLHGFEEHQFGERFL